MDTLGEWSDGDDNWIFYVDENSLWEWSDSEDDEIIRGIQESDQTGRGEKRKSDESLVPEEDFYEKECDKNSLKNSGCLQRITGYALITLSIN